MASFWAFPWGYRQGAVIAASLFIGAFILDCLPHRLLVLGGSASWGFVLITAAFIGISFVLFRDTRVMQYLSGKYNAVAAASAFLFCVIIMGLLPQAPERILASEHVFWMFRVKYSIVLFVMAFYLLVSLGYTVLGRCRAFTFRNAVFFLLHAGFFLIILGMCAGSGVLQTAMTVHKEDYVWYGNDQFGNTIELPIALKLEDFRIEYHGSSNNAASNVHAVPKQFISELSIITSDKKRSRALVAVNRPVSVHGYTLYQSGYDAAKGTQSDISVILAVHDPWIYAVYCGFILLALGSICMLGIHTRALPGKGQ